MFFSNTLQQGIEHNSQAAILSVYILPTITYLTAAVSMVSLKYDT